MKLKISTYRPYGLIERDPAESTYEVGDDKFPVVAHINDRRIAHRIVTCVNSCAGIPNPAAIPEVVEALKRLAREVKGCWGMDEPTLRQELGNTNYNAVDEKLTVALTALAKLEGGEG